MHGEVDTLYLVTIIPEDTTRFLYNNNIIPELNIQELADTKQCQYYFNDSIFFLLVKFSSPCLALSFVLVVSSLLCLIVSLY